MTGLTSELVLGTGHLCYTRILFLCACSSSKICVVFLLTQQWYLHLLSHDKYVVNLVSCLKGNDTSTTHVKNISESPPSMH